MPREPLAGRGPPTLQPGGRRTPGEAHLAGSPVLQLPLPPHLLQLLDVLSVHPVWRHRWPSGRPPARMPPIPYPLALARAPQTPVRAAGASAQRLSGHPLCHCSFGVTLISQLRSEQPRAGVEPISPRSESKALAVPSPTISLQLSSERTGGGSAERWRWRQGKLLSCEPSSLGRDLCPRISGGCLSPSQAAGCQERQSRGASMPREGAG